MGPQEFILSQLQWVNIIIGHHRVTLYRIPWKIWSALAVILSYRDLLSCGLVSIKQVSSWLIHRAVIATALYKHLYNVCHPHRRSWHWHHGIMGFRKLPEGPLGMPQGHMLAVMISVSQYHCHPASIIVIHGMDGQRSHPQCLSSWPSAMAASASSLFL